MSAEPLPEIKIAIGDNIADGKYVVKQKVGEGAYGPVFLVEDQRGTVLTMKVEAKRKNREEEFLKMEVAVLRMLQHPNSKHVAVWYACGVQDNFSYVVMMLLGETLSELRRRCPGGRMAHVTTDRIAFQAVSALEDMHNAGFIHRDIKPSNLAIGDKLRHSVFLMNFGLARKILVTGDDGQPTLREPRTKVPFRGTIRYCSLNAHLGKELGRHDDLWALLYTIIELSTGTLPWKGSMKDVEMIKATVTEKQLFKGVSGSMLTLYNELLPLTYRDKPNYNYIMGIIARYLGKANITTMHAPWEWETADDKEDSNSEKDEDSGTNKDMDENAQSATSQHSLNGSIDYDSENTLDSVADVEDSFREM